MELAVIAFLGLFGWDNAEFFNKVEENNKKGYVWEYVGRQQASDYNYSLPIYNEHTGEKIIYWEQVAPKKK